MLPAEFLERLKIIVPPDFLTKVINSFSNDKATTFRINTLKISIEDAVAQLQHMNFHLQPIAWNTVALIIPNSERTRLLESVLYHEGKIYLQGLSSMIPPLLLMPQPGEEILDLTAAPGSKTCQIACLMNNQGRIAAVEKSKPRFFKLKNNIEQQGASCVQLYLKDGAMVWRHCLERFDRVLLDAPCSSEGRFATNHAETFQYWSPKKIADMAKKQWALIYSAFQCLKPGGRLVYSTCTFAPEENEAIIAKLIKKFKDAVIIEPIKLNINNIQIGLTEWEKQKFPSELKNAVRILPNELMDGFFVCSIRKTYEKNPAFLVRAHSV